MPPVVAAAAVAGAVAGGVALVTGAVVSLTGALWVAAGAFASTLLTSVLNRPDSPFVSDIAGGRASARQTNQRKTLVFGETAVGGHLELFEPSGPENEYLNVVESHAIQPLADIVGWIINGEIVGELDDNNYVRDGRFAGRVRLFKQLGAYDQEATPGMIAEAPSWTADHKGGGVGGTGAILRFDAKTWPGGFRELLGICRGYVYDPREPQVSILSSTAPGGASVFTAGAAHGWTAGRLVWITEHAGARIIGLFGPENWRGQRCQIKTVPQADQFTLIDEFGRDVALTEGGTGGFASAMIFSDNWALNVRMYVTDRHTYYFRDEEIADWTAQANIADEQVPLVQTSSAFTIKRGVAAVATPNLDDDEFSLDQVVPWFTGRSLVLSSTGTPPAPLVAGTTYYGGLLGGSGMKIKLAATPNDAFAGLFISLLDIGTGEQTIADLEPIESALVLSTRSRWRLGDVVRITSTNDYPAPLLPGTDYFVSRSDGEKVWIAATLADARAGNTITITSFGQGDLTVTRFSQLRYTVNGFVTLGRDPVDALNAMVAAGAGAYTTLAGKLHLFAGVAGLPTGAIGQSDFSGDIELLPGGNRAEAVNGLRGVYPDPDDLYQIVPAPLYESEFHRIEDGGDRKIGDLAFEFTNAPEAVHRLLKINLLRSREDLTFAANFKPSLSDVAVWDVKPITMDYLGWAAKEFRVLSIQELEAAEYVIAFGEEAAGIWDYNLGEQVTAELAPNTGLPSPSVVSPPASIMLDSGDDQLVFVADGSVLPRIKVMWPVVPDAYVRSGGRIEIYAKKSADPDYTLASSVDGAATFGFVNGVDTGVAYDVRARSLNGAGIPSDRPGDAWPATVTGHVVIGHSAKPGGPDSFGVSVLADGTRRFDWAQAALPADVRSGGGHLIRFFIGPTSDWSVMDPLHTGKLVSSPFETNQLAAGTYTFAIKTVDSTDNESDAAIFVTATIGDPPLRNVLVQLQEALAGWPGAITGAFIDNNNRIAATGAASWDSLPTTWDGLAGSWDTIVARTSPITYETLELDVGLDLSFTPLVSVEAVGAVTVEMKTGTELDGGVVGAYVPVGPVTGARYVQVRVSVAGATPTIVNVVVLIDSAVVQDEFEDVDTATEAGSWFNRIAAGHFQVGSKSGDLALIAIARIEALQNTGAGYSWEVINKAVTVNGQPGAEFKIYNASGVLADATADIILRGPKKP